MLLTPPAFLKSVRHPTYALRDTSLMTYVKSYIFRHRDAVLR
jgi:hypothetical protein